MEILFGALAGFIGGMFSSVIFSSVGNDLRSIDKVARKGVKALAKELGGSVEFYDGLQEAHVYGLHYLREENFSKFFADFWNFVNAMGYRHVKKEEMETFTKIPKQR